MGLLVARRIIEAWRADYNVHRPQTSLRGLTPPTGSQPGPRRTTTQRLVEVIDRRVVVGLADAALLGPDAPGE